MAPPAEITFAQLLFGGIAAMLLAAGLLLVFFVTYQKRLQQQRLYLRTQEVEQQQQLLTAMIDAQESERERIGQDLHDGIGSTIATDKLLVSRLSATPTLPPPPDLLLLIEELMSAAMHDVRSVSHSLYPAVLARYGLAEALQHLVQVCNETGALAIRLELDYSRPLPRPQELALYRICQELVHNALKHAKGATRLLVELRQQGGMLLLLVEDDGCGFPVQPAQVTDGAGLRSIVGRVQMLKGRLHRHSTPGQGSCLTIELAAPV